jgi:HSP20 family protein
MRIVRYSYPNSRRSTFSPAFSRTPWSGLETEIDRLFETALGNFAGGQESATRFPVDLFQDKERTYVRAELPGVKREDVNVEVVEGYLTIAATRKIPASDDQAEQSFSFNRSLELPDEVQTDQITAAFENGILTVTLPKREEAKPRKISIDVK